MKALVLQTLVASLLISMATAWAEEPAPPAAQAPTPGMGMGRGMMNPPVFADFDTDGNGCISEQEFTDGWNNRRGTVGGAGANIPAFADFDTDQDGFISEQELNDGRAKRITERAGEGRPMRNVGNAASFAEIDTNKDNKIDPEEFAAHQMSNRQPKP